MQATSLTIKVREESLGLLSRGCFLQEVFSMNPAVITTLAYVATKAIIKIGKGDA